MSNYIREYHKEISEGRIVVGKWIKLLYEYIIKGLDEGLFFYSQKKANAAITFIENFCHHHEGVLAPQLLKLELWQKAALSVMFGVLDENGYRQFREVFMVVGRKNGKTL
jgi:phage terminase large subunit-like protein